MLSEATLSSGPFRARHRNCHIAVYHVVSWHDFDKDGSFSYALSGSDDGAADGTLIRSLYPAQRGPKSPRPCPKGPGPKIVFNKSFFNNILF